MSKETKPLTAEEHQEKKYLEYAGVILSCKSVQQVKQCRHLINCASMYLDEETTKKLVRVARTKITLLIGSSARIDLKGKFITERIDWIWRENINLKTS